MTDSQLWINVLRNTRKFLLLTDVSYVRLHGLNAFTLVLRF